MKVKVFRRLWIGGREYFNADTREPDLNLRGCMLIPANMIGGKYPAERWVTWNKAAPVVMEQFGLEEIEIDPTL